MFEYAWDHIFMHVTLSVVFCFINEYTPYYIFNATEIKEYILRLTVS